ncbi:MAG: hypothetical protein ACXVB0_11345 [Mucilaginibacter sp.]
MLNKFLLAFITICPLLAAAQEDKIVQTDSSIITTKYFEAYNSIPVFNELKDKSKTYFTEYYFNNRKLKEIGVFVNNDCYGIWKAFLPNGKLKYKIDYTNGVIIYYDKKTYPYFDLQNGVKLKGDSILEKVYGREFFSKHIIWDIGHSYIYHKDLSGDWTDNLDIKPTEFLLRYMIKFGGRTYPEIVEFELNSNGKFVSGKDVKGLEQLPTNNPKDFVLTLPKAIDLAKRRGLTENDTNKAKAFLEWEKTKSNAIYSGHFRIYVLIKTRSIEDIHPKGRSTIVDKFDVYIFNPWTSEFIERKKMKTIRGWEKQSGSSTGLLPDY